jgi:hypothetical protein
MTQHQADDHEHEQATSSPEPLEVAGHSRRSFFAMAGGAAVAASGLGALPSKKPPPPPPVHRPLTGYRDYTMAMHVHSSFSEGKASMQAQVSEAFANTIDVLWWTEHDWRMSAHGYRTTVHFDSLTQESEAGRPWTWQPQSSGAPTSVGGGIVSSPLSPRDPSQVGALRVTCVSSTSSTPASYRYYGNAGPARANQRANVTGQRLSVDVMPATVGPDAWLEILLTLSYRPAQAGRPAGQYQLSYRLGTAPAGRAVDATTPLLGVVTIPVAPGSYQTVTVNPAADVAAIWPDVMAGDNGLYDMWLGASSRNRATADGYFDYLTIQRAQAAGDAPLHVQAGFMAALGSAYPQMAQYAAQEASYFDQHMNLFAGDQHLYDYGQWPNVWSNQPNAAFATYLSDLIHGSGGLSAFNHPFGPAQKGLSTGADQDAARHKLVAALLGNGACHADIVELGFRQRGNASLETHLAVGDSLWRNGLWVTASGTNDNHTGGVGEWHKENNRFTTSAWADSAAEPDLVTALAGGRVFVGELGSWAGTLDLSVDGVVQMGQVSVRPGLASRSLTIQAAALPVGATVELVQGPVDYAGAAVLDPGSTVVTKLPASAFASGSAVLPVDTSTSSFVRVAVLSSTGTRIAFSNPVWLLREAARTSVPAGRVSADSR